MSFNRKAKRAPPKANAGKSKGKPKPIRILKVKSGNQMAFYLKTKSEREEVKIKRKKRARILCKMTSVDGQRWTFYRDKTYKLTDPDWNDDANEGEWELAHSERFGPILLQRNFDEDTFRTYWRSGDPDEKNMGEKIAAALADIEMENVLKGEYDEASTKADDRPKKRSKHAQGQNDSAGSTRVGGSSSGDGAGDR